MPARSVEPEHAVSWTLHPPLARGRVLLAEADDQFRMLMVENLERGGFHVSSVSSAAMLLRALTSLLTHEESKFDILVSDVQLPGWSGLTALNAMRCAGCRVPVILLAAFPGPELLVLARELEALLLTKPFELDELNRAVGARVSLGAVVNSRAAHRASTNP